MTKTNKNKQKITNTTKKVRLRTPRQIKILDVKQCNPNITVREIAKIADCSHVTVVNTLKKYYIDKQDVDNYRKYRGDILAGVQHRIIRSITDDNIKDMPVGQRIMSYGILYDKERLERNQATAITDDMSSIIDRIESRYTKAIDVSDVSQSDDNDNDIKALSD
jgi:hypothetical protein